MEAISISSLTLLLELRITGFKLNFNAEGVPRYLAMPLDLPAVLAIHPEEIGESKGETSEKFGNSIELTATKKGSYSLTRNLINILLLRERFTSLISLNDAGSDLELDFSTINLGKILLRLVGKTFFRVFFPSLHLNSALF